MPRRHVENEYMILFYLWRVASTRWPISQKKILNTQRYLKILKEKSDTCQCGVWLWRRVGCREVELNHHHHHLLRCQYNFDEGKCNFLLVVYTNRAMHNTAFNSDRIIAFACYVSVSHFIITFRFDSCNSLIYTPAVSYGIGTCKSCCIVPVGIIPFVRFVVCVFVFFCPTEKVIDCSCHTHRQTHRERDDFNFAKRNSHRLRFKWLEL